VAYLTSATEAYFAVLRPTVLAGRLPNADEQARGFDGVVVTASFAVRYNVAPGASVSIASSDGTRSVVPIAAVVADFREAAYDDGFVPRIIQRFGGQTGRRPSELTAWVRPPGPVVPYTPQQQPGGWEIVDMKPAAQVFDTQLLEIRGIATLGLGVFAVALFLATLGVYGLISHGMSVRLPELALRTALGASPRRIAAALMAESVRVTAFATVVGALIAAAFSVSVGSSWAERSVEFGGSVGIALLAVGSGILIAGLPSLLAVMRTPPSAVLRGNG
jgi:hypothetical protein